MAYTNFRFLMNFPKYNSIGCDNSKRNNYKHTEIFFNSCKILEQSKFTSKLRYFFYKKKKNSNFFCNFRNHCVFSGNNKAVYSKFKISRTLFKHNALKGNLIGVYCSVW